VARPATPLGSLGKLPEPGDRLKVLARTWSDQRDLIAEAGCAIGSLCMELNKQGRGFDQQAALLFAPLIDWAGDQFRELGQPFLSMVEAAALLANNLREPELLSCQIYRLEWWMDSLADR
jgi:TetR/AcrR family transcriptional regulator, transcriptional repressor for nem operon